MGAVVFWRGECGVRREGAMFEDRNGMERWEHHRRGCRCAGRVRFRLVLCHLPSVVSYLSGRGGKRTWFPMVELGWCDRNDRLRRPLRVTLQVRG